GIVGSWETLVGKQLELGFELLPRGKLAGMLVDVGAQGAGFLRRGAENAAQALGARLLSVEVRAPADIEAAFQALTRAHVNVAIVPTDPMLLNDGDALRSWPSRLSCRSCADSGNMWMMAD